MVSKIATGYTTDAKGRPFLRRNLRPGAVVVVILALVAVGTWIYAFSGSGEESYPTDCNIAEDAKLQPVNRSDMLSVSPAPLAAFRVTVLNSAAARGSARSVSDDLVSLGFTGGDPAYGDDTVYQQRDLHCVAQIRFGQAGQAAAAAVWLAAPCAQLVNDGRSGTDVDLALGEYYTSTQPSQDAQAAIESLRSADPKSTKSVVDRSILDAVHQQSC